MKNVLIFDMTRLCLLVCILIWTAETLPVGLQKYLSGNNYQVVLGPKEFVSKYDKSSKGTFVRLQDDSSSNSDSEYLIYGKLFVLKRKISAKLRTQEEETNVIIPRDSTNSIQYPRYNAKSESFEESIVFPKDTQGQRTEYKRFDYGSPTGDNFYKPTEMSLGRLEDENVPPIIPSSSRKSDSGKLQTGTGKIDKETNEPILDQEEGASSTFTVFKTETKKEEVPLGVVSIQDLEKWADVYKTTTSSVQIENKNAATNATDLSFQSLFIVPSLKNPQGGCPDGKRKNHAGVCVSPYIHRGNSNVDSSSTLAKPMTSSSTPIQSTLESLMESLRSVELQALQALLRSTPAPTTTESATTTDAVQIGSRNGFPTSDNEANTSVDINSPSSTPKSNSNNYVYSLLTPLLKHSRNSDYTLEVSTESTLLETLKEYGRINFDFSKVQQLQQKFNAAQRQRHS